MKNKKKKAKVRVGAEVVIGVILKAELNNL